MVHHRKQWDILALLLIVVTAAGLYAQSIGFAFVNDDPSGSLVWVESHSLVQLLLTSFNQFNYRPLGYMLWRLIWLAVGAWSPAYHLLSLCCHILNVILLWYLSLRLTGKRMYAISVCLIFSFFPFNYESVAYVTALFHPLALLFSLLMLLLYDIGRVNGRRIYLLGAGVALVAAFLSHPNAVVVPLLLVVWEFTRRPLRAWRDLLTRPIWPYMVILALYLLLRLLMPQAEGDVVPLLREPIRNIPPFIQSLVYPILPFVTVTDGNLVPLILMLISTLIITYWCALITNTRRLWCLACCWMVLAATPSVLLLDYQYIVGSPRLYYLSSVGAAMLWALPVIALTPLVSHSGWVSKLLHSLQVLLLAGLLISPLPYIICQMTYMSRASEFTLAMASSAYIVPINQELVYVNLPFYFTNCDGCRLCSPKSYPYAPIGAVVIPPYASLRDFLRFNGGPDRPARAVTWPSAEIDWAPFGETTSAVVLRQVVENGQVFLTQMDNGSLVNVTELWRQDRETGESAGAFSRLIELLDHPPELADESELEAAEPVGWVYGQTLELVAYQLEPTSVLPGNLFNLTLYWHVQPTSDVDATSRLIVQDRFGNTLVEREFAPVPGLPLDQWDPMVVYATRLQVTIPANSALGPASLILEAKSIPQHTSLTAHNAHGANIGTAPQLGVLLLGQSSSISQTAIIPDHPTTAVFGEQIALLGYSLTKNPLQTDDELEVTLYWQALKSSAVNYTVFVHLVDAGGQLVAQHDSEPNNGQYPTSIWKTGDVIKDVHQVSLSTLPAGRYILEVGFYQWPSLERLQVTVGDTPQGDVYLLAPIQLAN